MGQAPKDQKVEIRLESGCRNRHRGRQLAIPSFPGPTHGHWQSLHGARGKQQAASAGRQAPVRIRGRNGRAPYSQSGCSFSFETSESMDPQVSALSGKLRVQAPRRVSLLLLEGRHLSSRPSLRASETLVGGTGSHTNSSTCPDFSLHDFLLARLLA